MAKKTALESVKEYQARNKAMGLCLYCSNPSPDKRTCDPCREKRKTRRTLRKTSGLCRDCSSPKINNNSYCENHSLSNIARQINNESTGVQLKELLVNQNYKCALTNDPIALHNMELDHIIPKSKGGSNVITNLRWVTKEANRAKSCLSDEDFISLCHKVIAKKLAI